MARDIHLGTEVVDQFPVWKEDGYTKKSGETSFAVSLWRNGVISAVPVAISEIGSTGEYKAVFTPDSLGFWLLEIIPTFNHQPWKGEYEVEYGSDTDINLNGAISDDTTTVKVALWLELDGEPVFDVDSMSAKVKEPDGTEVSDLGTKTAPSPDGVFEFEFSTSLLTAHTPYLVAAIATKAGRPWYGNFGFVKVG
jgi:hypothetical protein